VAKLTIPSFEHRRKSIDIAEAKRHSFIRARAAMYSAFITAVAFILAIVVFTMAGATVSFEAAKPGWWIHGHFQPPLAEVPKDPHKPSSKKDYEPSSITPN
jgi:Ni/Fe-hydrogenase subunit HybB-like protein